MKTSTRIGMIFLICLVAGVSAAQGQDSENYTFFSNEYGPQICFGTWVPSSDVALPGVCQGQTMPLYQVNALSGRQTVDKLDKMLLFLEAMDQKLSVGNDQMNSLIETTVNTQTLLEQYSQLVSESLSEAIDRRFDELPKEIMDNELFKQELDKLKTDILKEVEKRYSKPLAAPKKK